MSIFNSGISVPSLRISAIKAATESGEIRKVIDQVESYPSDMQIEMVQVSMAFQYTILLMNNAASI